MNKTSYIIVKLLLQQSLTEKEIIKYLKMTQLTFKNNLTSINLYLQELSFSTIYKNENGEYQLNLTEKQKIKFFEKYRYYSENQRCNYLILKLLINKTLNLEKERKLLDISSSTIKRDFYKIKKKFLDVNIEIISKQWQGVFLNEISNEILCEILIKFFYEFDFLPGILKQYFLENQKPNMYKENIKIFYNLFEIFNLKIGELALRYFLALRYCFYLFSNFKLKILEEELMKLKDNKNYIQIYNKIKALEIYADTESQYFALNIYYITFKIFLKQEKYSELIKKFEEKFKLLLSPKEKYNFSILIHYGIFKFNNSIYSVKKIKNTVIDLKLLKLLVDFFQNNQVRFYYGDKLQLLEYLEEIIIRNEIKLNKKILILKREVNQENMILLKKYLEETYTQFNFNIESFIYLSVSDNKKLKEFDLILSEEYIEVRHKIYSYIFEIPNLINKFLLELKYKKLI